MSCKPASVKFWETPELIEKLLPNLDLKSTVCLARTHVMTQNILQRRCIWNKLIRRSCLFIERGNPFGLPNGPKMPHKIDMVKDLVTILKLMTDPNAFLLDLLDFICERFTPEDVHLLRQNTHVAIRCPRHPDLHFIPLAGFLLLEEVEGAFGTTEQSLELVEGHLLTGPSLSAVSSRISRQTGSLPSAAISLSTIEIQSRREAESFKTLMQVGPQLLRHLELDVSGAIGRKGWGALTKAIQSQPNLAMRVVVPKSVLAGGSTEDLRDFWNVMGPDVQLAVQLSDNRSVFEYIEKQNGANGWMRLEHILEATKNGWIEQLTEEEEEEEELGEEEGEEEEKKEKSEDGVE